MRNGMRFLFVSLIMGAFIACSEESESEKNQKNTQEHQYSVPEVAQADKYVAQYSSPEGAPPMMSEDIFLPEQIAENSFIEVEKEEISTFSIDVDTASYTLARQMLNNGVLPSPSQIRTEEFINFFKYQYTKPTGDTPFAVQMQSEATPWREGHQLLKIGIQGKSVDISSRPVSNLAFLIDVSGSMSSAGKLGILKRGLISMVEKFGENDRLAIVVYAGAAGLVLDSTTGTEKEKIIASLSSLNAGGSTNGGAGIELAYKIALENKIEGGINRVILCTDGDFNVGTTTKDSLDSLIMEKAQSGIELSVLGVGMRITSDQRMESIANKGNGNYYYLDSDAEAKRVLITEMSGTLQTIAKDVKVQVQFNSEKVKSYKLIGYENRLLANEDFADDSKDAGELGSGHSVTAIYQIELLDENIANEDLLTLDLRYKDPGGEESKLVQANNVVNPTDSKDFSFASAVAAFTLKLRGSEEVKDFSFDQIISLVGNKEDLSESRKEFIDLVQKAQILADNAKEID
mgnify:CR=1 FL=1